MRAITTRSIYGAVALLLLSSGVASAADDPCKAFKWDLARERALFAAPAGAPVDGNALPAAAVALDTAVELVLSPQETVKFVAPPAKTMLTDGAYAGVATFHVATSGIYRIAVDAPFWIDVLADGTALKSVDFDGPGHNCPPPSKVVTYDLPSGRPLTLQLSGATEQKVRVAITKAP